MSQQHITITVVSVAIIYFLCLIQHSKFQHPHLAVPLRNRHEGAERPGQKKQSPPQAPKAIMKECMQNEAYDQGGNQHWPMNLRNSMPTTSPPWKILGELVWWFPVKRSRFLFRLLLQQEIRFASLLMLRFHKGDFQDINEHWSKWQVSKGLSLYLVLCSSPRRY